MSSISHFGEMYAQNAKTLPEYYAALDENELSTRVGYRMTKDDRIRKHVIMRLMCDLELDKRDVEIRFGIDFDSYFAESLDELQRFVEDGLVEIGVDRIAVKGAGLLLLRNVAMCFDAYLDKIQKDKPVFSQTV